MSFKLNTELVNTAAVVEAAAQEITETAQEAVAKTVEPIHTGDTVTFGTSGNFERSHAAYLIWDDNNSYANNGTNNTQVKPNRGFKVRVAAGATITVQFYPSYGQNFEIDGVQVTTDTYTAVINEDKEVYVSALNASAYIMSFYFSKSNLTVNDVLFNNVVPISVSGLTVGKDTIKSTGAVVSVTPALITTDVGTVATEIMASHPKDHYAKFSACVGTTNVFASKIKAYSSGDGKHADIRLNTSYGYSDNSPSPSELYIFGSRIATSGNPDSYYGFIKIDTHSEDYLGNLYGSFINAETPAPSQTGGKNHINLKSWQGTYYSNFAEIDLSVEKLKLGFSTTNGINELMILDGSGRPKFSDDGGNTWKHIAFVEDNYSTITLHFVEDNEAGTSSETDTTTYDFVFTSTAGPRITTYGALKNARTSGRAVFVSGTKHYAPSSGAQYTQTISSITSMTEASSSADYWGDISVTFSDGSTDTVRIYKDDSSGSSQYYSAITDTRPA